MKIREDLELPVKEVRIGDFIHSPFCKNPIDAWSSVKHVEVISQREVFIKTSTWSVSLHPNTFILVQRRRF